jgi:hypothetical protein
VLCRLLCALLFLAWTAEPPIANDAYLFRGLWRSPLGLLGPLFVTLPGIHLSPWQLAVIGLAPVCLFASARRRAALLDAAIAVSLSSIAVTFAWGWVRGGSPYEAYYQLWRFLAGLLVALMLVAAMRSSRDVKALGLTVLAAAIVRGTLAIYFYWTMVRGKIEPAPPYLTSHDDSLLFVAGLLVAAGWALARSTPAAWLAAAAVSAQLLYAITLNNRRLAWIEMLVAFALVYFILPRGKVRRRVNLMLLVAGPAILLYVIVGWNRTEPFFAPLQAVSTVSSYENSSTLAREEENRNLLHTLSRQRNPLAGAGWGMPYQKVSNFYADFGEAFAQHEYQPHNSLLGIAVFSGLIGLAGIWLVVPVSAYLAMRGYRAAAGPVERAAALAVLGVLAAYGVHCYGDLGFQSLTCTLLLAAAMSTAGRVSLAEGVRPGAGRAAPRDGRRGPALAPPVAAALAPVAAAPPPRWSGARE